MEGTQEAARAWFTEFQLHCVVRNGIIPEWFHGIISRKAAEDMLQSKPPGHFLLRISESRIGYTLSYRSEGRCRHFMIDAQWDGCYVIVGETMRHRSLQDLVDFHRTLPIMPFNELLTVACGQVSKENADYAEILFPKKSPIKPDLDPPPHTHNNNSTHLNPDRPPTLPHRPITMRDSTLSSPHSNKALPAVPNSHRPRLYPCLETELPSVSLQHPTTMESSGRPVPLPRKRLAASTTTTTAIPADQPPKLPARTSIPQRNAQTPTPVPDGLLEPWLADSDRPPIQPNVHQHLDVPNQTQTVRNQEGKLAVINHIRRKFQKMRTSSQEHEYAEINVEEVGERCEEGQARDSDTGQVTEKENQGVSGTLGRFPSPSSTNPHLDLSSAPAFSPADAGVPPEYLQPPPFAPGY